MECGIWCKLDELRPHPNPLQRRGKLEDRSVESYLILKLFL